MEEVPDWFWAALAATRPHIGALEDWLTAQPRETVELFAHAYQAASCDLADYSAGIALDGTTWSEDSMEDLCDWVVGQGEDFWGAVLTGDVPLTAAAEAYLGRPSPLTDRLVRWDHAVRDDRHRGCATPAGIAGGVYWTRFGAELHERINTPEFHRRFG